MRATGIVRRIDELGRVVIPKEIRRTLRIREGDPLEIYTDKDGEVILKKYSPIGEISNFAKDYTESLFRSLGHIACITDKDMIVSAICPRACAAGTGGARCGPHGGYRVLRAFLPEGFRRHPVEKEVILNYRRECVPGCVE